MKNTNFNYIDILNNELEQRSAKNASYSLRAFARDLNMNASRLSEILNRKKGISEKAAKEVAENLNLNDKEKEFFILSATSQHSRSSKIKEEATLNLKNQLKIKAHDVSLEEFERAQNWYHFAILELIELKDCDHTVKWFAQKLKLKTVVVQGAVDRLLSLGWLSLKDGKFVARDNESQSSYDVPSNAIKKYHEEILNKAGQSLFTDDVKEREFLNMTLAFSQDQVDEAKEAIRKFQKEFAEKFYVPEKEKDSVYQLSVQLFRLDTKLQ